MVISAGITLVTQNDVRSFVSDNRNDLLIETQSIINYVVEENVYAFSIEAFVLMDETYVNLSTFIITKNEYDVEVLSFSDIRPPKLMHSNSVQSAINNIVDAIIKTIY